MRHHRPQQLDIRPALVLATVKDEERRRQLMVISSALDAPETEDDTLSVATLAFLGVIVIACGLLW